MLLADNTKISIRPFFIDTRKMKSTAKGKVIAFDAMITKL